MDSPTSSTPQGVTETSSYQARLESGSCTYSNRCNRPLADGASLCERHLKRERRRVAKAQKDARNSNRALGLCAFCPTKSETYRCPVHAIRHRQIPSGSTSPGVTAAPFDPFRPDANGWARYRGKGRRGAPSAAVDDDQDMARATDHVTRGRQALAYARSPEVMKLGRIQQAGAMRAALSELELAARFIESIVERRMPSDG